MRIKFIKNHKEYRKGQIVALRTAEAKQLLKAGVAIISKDMTDNDYRVTK